MKKVLIIAFHYPPVKTSSAVQRTLKFSQYLINEGWQPIILTVSPKAAWSVSNEQIHEIPDNIIVKRCFALDTARHLSINGRYIKWMSLPDRWISWHPAAVIQGLMLIRKHRPDAIMSTYPIATAHLIALTLKSITKLPWIADFRDSMTEDNYPADKTQRNIYKWIESKVINNASRILFTTKGAVDMYSQRYPDKPSSLWSLIPNGYDEENFKQAEKLVCVKNKKESHKITLLHSGIIYPNERDPGSLFKAISKLKHDKFIDNNNFELILRATGHDNHLLELITNNDIGDIVSLKASISYEKALIEMLSVDALLILQSKSCNHQIPAKIYEYLRAGKPILALTDIKGDTAKLLLKEGATNIVDLNNADKIKSQLIDFIKTLKQQNHYIPSSDNIYKYSRKARTTELAEILNQSIKK